VVSALVVKRPNRRRQRPRAEIRAQQSRATANYGVVTIDVSRLGPADIRAGGCDATNCSPIPTYGVRTCAIQRGPIGIQQGEGCSMTRHHVPKSSPTV
jgi:hypothetical protein